MNSTEQLQRYRETLLKWTARVNLIGPEVRRDLDDHIAEAVRAAEILTPAGEVLDFGSGGGLPAIPMAIVSPQAHFHLVEADQRKWAFLKHVVRECALNCTVHGDRLARVLRRLDRGLLFSLVTSRAVGKGEEWLPLVAEHLAPGGRVALFQGTPEPPAVDGFDPGAVVRLPRGSSNFLVVLQVNRQNG